MDLHIDDFYKDAASGLLALYQAFPRKIDLYVEDLIGREEPDEFGLPSTRHQSCLGTLLWLAEEGYLRFNSSIGYDALDQAVLTEKAFLRLSLRLPSAQAQYSHLPASVQRVQSTLAFQLREAINRQESEHVAHLAQLLLRSTLNCTSDIV